VQPANVAYDLRGKDACRGSNRDITEVSKRAMLNKVSVLQSSFILLASFRSRAKLHFVGFVGDRNGGMGSKRYMQFSLLFYRCLVCA
jgi:hypothetical protein